MIITRYLTREVTNALLAVITVLLLAFVSQQIVRYLNWVAIGKIPTSVLLQLVSFEIPYLLALLFPLGLYLGIMLAYGRLATDNELSIMQMCGFGGRRIVRLTATIALVVTGFVLFLMLWINPMISAKRQQVINSDEATLHLIQTLIPGRFQVSPDGKHVMFVEKLSRDHQRAENVFIAEEKTIAPKTEESLQTDETLKKYWMVVSANQGYQMKDKATGEIFFVTADGNRYEGIPGQNDFKIVQYKKYAIRLPQNDMQIKHRDVETLSTSQLWEGHGNPKYAAEFQWRFSIALATFVLAMFALPLSTIRPRYGRYLMLLPGVLVYIVYINLLFVARHWVEQGTVPVSLGMWWVHLIMFVLVIIVIGMKGMKWQAWTGKAK